MYIYHPNTKMTHKNDGFIENLMKVPAPLKVRSVPEKLFSLIIEIKRQKYVQLSIFAR